VLFALLLSLHAISATIRVRSMQDSETGATLESTTQTETSSSSSNDPSAELAGLRSRFDRNNDFDEPCDTDLDASRIDWREDESLRLESMREAGFLPSSFEEDE
jgi:hypothetical protein